VERKAIRTKTKCVIEGAEECGCSSKRSTEIDSKAEAVHKNVSLLTAKVSAKAAVGIERCTARRP
jgi:hypothetical protein